MGSCGAAEPVDALKLNTSLLPPALPVLPAYDLFLRLPSRWEAVSNFASGAAAGLVLEAAVHAAGHATGSIKTRQLSIHHPWSPPWRAISTAYRGAAPTLAAGAAWSGIFGSCYVPVQQAVDNSSLPYRNYLGPLLAACSASFAASSIRVPLRWIKDAVAQTAYKLTPGEVALMNKTRLLAVYNGWHAHVLRDLPLDGILFLNYETFKSMYQQRVCRELHTAEFAALGGVAGAITGTVTSIAGILFTSLKCPTCLAHPRTLSPILSKACGTAFEAAVFFPSLEAAIVTFDFTAR